ncbi:13724_t:CDS:2, partial [Racocetra persica]
MARPQVNFCIPIGEQLTELEKACGVKDYSAEQVKYNSLIQRRSRRANLKTLATTADGNNTLLRWPQLYYAFTLLFQDINFNVNTGNKLMLDFYQILRVNIFGHGNNTLDSLQADGTEQGLLKYQFPLAQAQEVIEKQWCITRISNVDGNAFVQFNTEFFWFITVLDINKSLRYLKYITDQDKESRYNLGTTFAPGQKEEFLREP